MTPRRSPRARRGFPHFGGAAGYVALALFALVVAAERGGAASATADNEAADWVRPEDVPLRVDALLRRLEEAQPGATVEQSLDGIERALPRLGHEIDSLVRRANDAILKNVALSELDDVRRELVRAASPLADWRDELAKEAKRVAAILDMIAQAQRTWLETRSKPETAVAGTVVQQRVESAIAALSEADTSLRTWRARVLAASDHVLQRVSELDNAQDKLRDALAGERASLLVPDSAPLWSRQVVAEIRSELPRVPDEIAAYAESTATYFRNEPRPLMVQALIAVFLIVSLGRFSSRAVERLAGEAGSARAARLLERPYAIGLLLVLVASPFFHPLAPRRFIQLVAMVAIFPAARILMHAVDRAKTATFAGLFLLLLLDRLGLAIEGLPALRRATFLVTLLLGGAMFLWLSRRTSPADGSTWQARVGRIGMLGIAFAILAEIGGWTHLAELIGRGLIAATIAAVYVYAGVLGLATLLTYALVSRTAQRSHVILRNMASLQRRMEHVLRWLGAGAWLYFVATGLGLRGAAGDALAALLDAGIKIGALSLSFGGVLAFVCVVVVSLLVARIATSVLEEDVYPRAQLPRGIPYVLSTLVRYACYSFGFMMALAAAGVQLGQVTIMVGGLGIGIGLGLQDLVKNFAAGLTLLIERRVHVGDMLEISSQGIFGNVISIGPRASVVRTMSGAEVLVPNSDLISSAVTNWTLSDRHCRIEVPVGVAYGTDPERVIALLLESVRANDQMLSDPAPDVLFQGFGDSSLNFLVRAWIDGYERRLSMSSQLALGMHRALYAAGITIPFPQRDLNLATVSPAARAALHESGRGSERERDGSDSEKVG